MLLPQDPLLRLRFGHGILLLGQRFRKRLSRLRRLCCRCRRRRSHGRTVLGLELADRVFVGAQCRLLLATSTS
jgi:hypothetical protein